MKSSALLLLLSCLLCHSSFSQKRKISETGFIQNLGQIANEKHEPIDSIDFKIEQNGLNGYISPSGISYHFYHSEKKTHADFTPEERKAYDRGDYNEAGRKLYFFRLDFKLIGHNTVAEVEAENEVQFKSNYYLSHCLDGITNVPSYSKLTYRDIYPQIDLVYKFDNNQLKYEFIVHPGGNPEDIQFTYDGADEIIADEKGLKVISDYKIIKEAAPITFYSENQEAIGSKFLLEDKTVRFSVDQYDMTQDIIIDPTVTWATYQANGGGSDFHANGAFDSNENIYFAYASYSATWPVINAGAGQYYDAIKDGSADVVVIRYNANLSQQWATYFGGDKSDFLCGTGGDYGKALDIDDNDDIYVGGHANAGPVTFPTLNSGAPGAWYQDQTNLKGGDNAFLAKFNTNGVLQWSTLYQHTNASSSGAGIRINGIVCQGTKVYFTGQSYQFSGFDIPFVSLAGAYNNTAFHGDQCMILGRFNNNCVLEWSTYLNSGSTGGSATYAQGSDLTFDPSGNMILAGQVSGDPTAAYVLNPGGGAYFDNTISGFIDHTITKFNTSLQPTWSTIIGGTDLDRVSEVSTDNSGNILVACRTARAGMPTVNPGGGAFYQASLQYTTGGFAQDGFIMKFSPTGVYTWGTYVGATAGESHITGISSDNLGNIYAIGYSFGNNFPIQSLAGSYNQSTLTGTNSDLVLMKFTSGGVNTWSTYYGGTAGDNCYGRKIKPSTIANSCGYKQVFSLFSQSTNFPTVNPGGGAFYESSLTGSSSNTLLYIEESGTGGSTAPTSILVAQPAPGCAGVNVNLTVSGGSLASGDTWTWYTGGCGSGSAIGTGTSISVSPTSNTTYYVRAEGPCGNTTCASVTVTVIGTGSEDASWTSPGTICEAAGNISLTPLITGDAGGTWSGTGVSGTTFNPSGLSGSINVTYTVGTAPCTVSETNVIIVAPNVNPVWSPSSPVCEAAGNINLNTMLGSATIGGTWSGTGVTGTTFNPSGLSGSINVTYTVGSAPCQETSTQSITVIQDVNPAWTGSGAICEANGTINLNPLITGTTGGTWSGTGVSGTNFNPSGLSGAISITYTVGTAPCQETSTQNITVNPNVDPVWTTPGTICEANGNINLNSSLGSATTGGTWSGSGVSGNTFDPSGLSGNIAITYTVGTAPCQETSTQNINVSPDVNPSWTDPSPVCESGGNVNLNGLITGTPGGTWSGTGVSGNSFDPSGLSGSISITYTVGTGACQETSTIMVSITATPSAAWTNPGTICEAAGSINLNSTITGTSGGTWSGTGVSGNTFDPSGLSGSVSVTYSVGSGSCLQTSTLGITVTPDVDPTWSNPGTVCDGAGTVNLNGTITGTPGGTWSGTGVSGSTFDPTGLNGQSISITYTVGTAPCIETLQQTINVQSAVSATWTNPGTICGGAGNIDLSTYITGSTGGTFTGTGVTGNMLDPSALSGNVTITYNIGSGTCSDMQAQTINVIPDVDPTWTNPSPVCISSGSINLNTLITGTTGGIWSGTGVTGSTFDPTGLAGQSIFVTYLVGTAPCQEQSVLTVTVTNTVSAAWTAPTDMCESDAILDLNTLVTGDLGGTWTGTGVSGSNFDPIGLNGAINLTYTVGTAPCQDTQMSSINILSAPVAPSVSSISDTICAGDTTSLTASGSGAGVNYEVYDAITGGTNLGQTPLIVMPSSTTTYYIEAVNANNCANIGGRIAVTVEVEALPLADAGPDQTACPGDLVNLIASGGTDFNWDHGDLTAASSITASSTQYYYVTVSNTNCSARDSVLVTVNTPGTVSALNDNTNGTAGNLVSFNVSANDSGDPNTVSIIGGPYSGSATSSGGIINYTSNTNFTGTDSIHYQICDAICTNLCDSATLYISIEEGIDISVPNGFTPNGDGINETLVIHGLDQHPENVLLIYNRWGDLVFTGEPYNNNWNGQSEKALYGDKVVDGTYFYILTYENASNETVKLNGYIEVKSK